MQIIGTFVTDFVLHRQWLYDHLKARGKLTSV